MTPKRQTTGSAAADLCSTETVVIQPGKSAHVGTGYLYHVANPLLYGRVTGRSSLAFHNQVVANEGTIDSDYVGKEVRVLLWNFGAKPFTVTTGDRIAQLIICPQNTHMYFETTGATRKGGFGSTGKGEKQ